MFNFLELTLSCTVLYFSPVLFTIKIIYLIIPELLLKTLPLTVIASERTWYKLSAYLWRVAGVSLQNPHFILFLLYRVVIRTTNCESCEWKHIPDYWSPVYWFWQLLGYLRMRPQSFGKKKNFFGTLAYMIYLQQLIRISEVCSLVVPH